GAKAPNSGVPQACSRKCDPPFGILGSLGNQLPQFLAQSRNTNQVWGRFKVSPSEAALKSGAAAPDSSKVVTMQTLNVGAGRTDTEYKAAEKERRADLRAESQSDANYFF